MSTNSTSPTTAGGSSAAAHNHADRRKWMALVVVCLAQLMNILDSTVVNVALPKIQHDLGFSQANLTWVLDAYLISFGSFLLLAGRIGDLVGRKKVFLSGVALFTLFSAICGIANSQIVLIVARFLQGVAGATCASVILAIISTEFREPAERAKAMSAYIFVVVSGGSIGLLAGGILTQFINWRWDFFVNVPIGIFALIAGYRLLDENRGLGLSKGVDWLGSLLVTAGVMLGVYAIAKAPLYGWGSAHTLGFLAAAVVILAGFVALESRLEDPIMPLRLFRIRSLIASSIVRGTLISGMFAAFFLGALYLQGVRGYSALDTGLAFLPQTLVVGVMSRGITTRLAARFGNATMVIAGLLLMAASLGLISQVTPHTAYAPVLVSSYVLLGLGAGCAMSPLLAIALSEVPHEDAGLGSGIVNVSLQLAAAVGVAVFSSIATGRSKSLEAAHDSLRVALTGGYRLGFAVGCGTLLVAVLLAIVLLRPRTPRQSTEIARANADIAAS
ncbi:MAG TPA: MFS transporter [Solirubrobacteraceae bacterium]|nr:MFS transporter [Solirubrobacteraceae bacterium]